MPDLSEPFTVDLLLPQPGRVGLPRREYSEDDKRAICPTLVVGLGSAGYEVARRLKERMRPGLGDARMVAHQFLVFATRHQRAYHPTADPLTSSEFVYLPVFQADRMVQNLDGNDSVGRWWPLSYVPAYTGDGTGGVRALGRLIGHKYASSFIAPRIGQRIEAMLAGAHAFEVKAMPRLYVVASAAGGASGMLVDVAYILRHEMEKRYPEGYMLTAVLLMPSVFVGAAPNAAARERMQANGYACLYELDLYNAGLAYSEDFDSGHTVESTHKGKPFDMTYLVGRSNEQGLTLPTAEAVYDLVSLGLATESAPPVEGNLIDALSASTLRKRATRKPAAFSSFGVGGLVFPLQGVATWCALRAQAQFTKNVLLSPVYGQEQAEREAGALAEQAGLGDAGYEGLIQSLSAGGHNPPLAAPALALGPSAFEGIPDAGLLPALRNAAMNAQSTIAGWKPLVDRNLDSLAEAKLANLRTMIGRAVMDPERGLAYVQWLLSKLAIYVMKLRAGYAARQAQDAARNRGITESRTRQADEAIGAVLSKPGLRLGRSQGVKSAVRDYVAAANDWSAATFRVVLAEAVVRLYDRVLEEVNALQQWANQSFLEMQRSAEEASTAAEQARRKLKLLQNKPGPVRSVLTEDLLSAIYTELDAVPKDARARHQAAGDFWLYVLNRDPEGARSWQPGTEGQIFSLGGPEVVFEFLRDRAESALTRTSLLARLSEETPEAGDRSLREQFAQAAPFWSLLGTARVRELRGKGRQVDVVSYGEESSGARWPAEIREATGAGRTLCAVRSLNDQEIIFMRSAHDLPLSALREVEIDLKPAYRLLQADWKSGKSKLPVHASREWEASIAGSEEETRDVHQR